MILKISLLKVKEIFISHPEVLKILQNTATFLLMSFHGYQLIQYQIVRMLAEKAAPFFVVGDDDQSIYSFRGPIMRT